MSELLPAKPSLDRVLSAIRTGEQAHEVRVRQYDHAYEIWRSLPPKGLKKQPWESSLRVPYGMQNIETALVNIVGGTPRAKVKPRRPQDVETAPKMETILDYHVHEDHLAEKWPLFVWQGLVYPVTAAKNHWLYRESERVSRQFLPNPSDPYRPLALQGSERVVLRDGPTFEPWDIYDLWWEPMARDVDSAAYIVLRSWPSRDDLLAQARSEQNPFGLYDLLDLELMLKDGPGQTGTRTSAAERMKESASDKRKDRFELLEIWRDDSLVVIGNRRVVLRSGPNPYWHGRKPIVIAQTRLDGFEITGIPETEMLDHLQQGLHTLTNMVIDNLHLTVQRGFTYRESGVLDPRSLVVKPRYMWPVADHDDIKAVEVQPLPGEAYRERDVMKGDMQTVSGISPYISGADTANIDQNTATGIATLSSAASQLLRYKARMLAYKGLQRTFEQWGELVQQFTDREQSIRIEGPDGFSWQDIQPQELAGNYDYTIQGVEESISRQQERNEAVALLNAFAPFANLGVLNWPVLLRKVAEAFDFDAPEALVREQPQVSPAAPGNGGPPPQQPPLDPRLLSGAPLQPGILQQVTGAGR